MREYYIITDSFANHLFTDKTFSSFEDAWYFIDLVIELSDGTTDDRDDELGGLFVRKIK